MKCIAWFAVALLAGCSSTQAIGDGTSTNAEASSTTAEKAPDQIIVKIWLGGEAFTEHPDGSCEGKPPFDALHTNNTGNLIGASNLQGNGAFGAGFTVSEIGARDGARGCVTTIEFINEVDADPAGYYVEVGPAGAWRAGPVFPDPGPNAGIINLYGCAGVPC